jgi:hypothetical protein
MLNENPLTETSAILTPGAAPKTKQPGRATLVTFRLVKSLIFLESFSKRNVLGID